MRACPRRRCIGDSSVPLLILSGVFMLIVVACGIVCFLDWRRVGTQRSDQPDEGTITTRQFLGLTGSVSSVFFLIVMLATTLPDLFLRPGMQ